MSRNNSQPTADALPKAPPWTFFWSRNMIVPTSGGMFCPDDVNTYGSVNNLSEEIRSIINANIKIGLIRGKVICHNCCFSEAPSIVAASYKSRLIVVNPAI